jgi:tetratricopeptide (TPR) repeat protein
MNALKLSRACTEDPALLAEAQALEEQAAVALADTYLNRARYEESNGRPEDAARSYSRAALGKPSPEVFQKAAECYLKAGTELRQAAEMARKSVGLAPDRVELRLTLARVYEAAGMRQSAVAELERCAQMSPNNPRIHEWLKRSRNEGV